MKSMRWTRRRFVRSALTLGALPLASAQAAARIAAPAGYPPEYLKLIEAAQREGQLNILGSTDKLAADPLVRAFEAAYPGVRVSYADLNTREVDKRFRAEDSTTASTDIVWSSAMDTQIALIQDGLAQAYTSPEAHKLPAWATWRNLAYAATYEPVVFVYHAGLFPEGSEATSHEALRELLIRHRERLRGKVVTLDIGKSNLALMLEANDQRANPNHDALLRALGSVQLAIGATNGDMLKNLAAGDALLGYNMLGSYAEVFARRHPQIGYVIPRDYALVVSRVLLIAARAPHPNAARLWLDFVLSATGQRIMATACGLGAVRADVDGPFTLQSLRRIPGLRLRPIGVSHQLLDYLDPLRRLALIERWRQRVGVAG